MKQIHILLLCVISFSLKAQTNSPYELSWKTDGGIATYSCIGLGTFISINSKVKPLSTTQIAELDSKNINNFDRKTTNNYSSTIDTYSDYGAAAGCMISVGITGLLILNTTPDRQSFWNHASTLAVLCAETNMVTVLTTNIIKSSVLRARPYMYNPDAPIDDKISIHARKSFFSSHTAVTAANSFFMAQVVSDYYPNTWMSYSAWGLAATLPAVIGYMRVEAGRHFPTDVIAGYVFGTSCGLLIPYLHKKTSTNKNSHVSVGISPELISLKVMF